MGSDIDGGAMGGCGDGAVTWIKVLACVGETDARPVESEDRGDVGGVSRLTRRLWVDATDCERVVGRPGIRRTLTGRSDRVDGGAGNMDGERRGELGAENMS